MLDAKADLLVYGMGERPIREIAERLKRGEAIQSIRDVRGTCAVVSAALDPALDAGTLPEYARLRNRDPASSRALAEHFTIQQQNADPRSARPLLERYDGNRRLIRNPPAFPLGGAELDQVYELPFTREAHPQYAAAGIPALQEVSFSLVSSRGCFGGCSFCAIAFHQGRAVSHRTQESLVREAGALAKRPDFKGYIHDVGGPTANFFSPPCDRQRGGSFCPDRNCLYPEPCPQLQADHREYLAALAAIRGVRGIKKVFIRSGIRYDYIALDRTLGAAFLETLCRHHVSGQLKVAPEHCSPRVLKAMGKGGFDGYERFCAQYAAVNRRLGLRQYLVPYFMASHPASALEDAAALAQYLRRTRFAPNQTQDFYPTPGTLSTVMYAAGIDPRTMEPVAVCRGAVERRLQRALLRFHNPPERDLALEALRKAGRVDLIKLLR